MAFRGQKFTLDPDADNFTFNVAENDSQNVDRDATDFIKEIRERETSDIPPPPRVKPNRRGFPQPRQRTNVSTFKSRQQRDATDLKPNPSVSSPREPSDRAILNQVNRKYGIDPESRDKANISEENKKRIAQMSTEDIEEARSEIMANFSPAFIERLLRRANIEEDQENQDWDKLDQRDTIVGEQNASEEREKKKVTFASAPSEKEMASNTTDTSVNPTQSLDPMSNSIETQSHEDTPSMHFPYPRRNPDDYVELDPDSPAFLSDLKKHYFPSLPDDPSTLAWLQDPTEEESESSPYAPTQTRYAPSDIRFGFNGRLIAPAESREIPVSQGLHHHGHAPESAGYTIPELSILTRSALPNQRCIAYQILGRILYRLGRGDFGPRGSELQEGLWACVEKERPVEVMMSEANRTGGHVSANAYATEALWLWRKGGGGDRGILKPGEKIAK